MDEPPVWQDAVQHARLVLHGKEDGRLVAAGGPHRSPADHEEAGAVGGVVLDAAPQHGHVIGAGGQLRGHRGHRGIVLGALGGGGGGGHLLQARLRQVREQPLACLRETLRVRAHDLDLLELRGPGEEMLADVEGELSRDHRVGLDEPVEGDVDGALRGVLHGHHAALRTSALDLLEDVRDAPQRDQLGRGAEAAHGRRVGEGSRRAQVADGERVLESQRSGKDLAPDGAEGIRGERPRIQGEQAVDELGLPLRDKVRPVLLPLELADLEGGLPALIEEVEDLFVEVVDPGSPVVQVHRSS